MKWFKWFRRKPKKIRLCLRYVSYDEAETYLKFGWTIAPEEDRNINIGMVYLELLKEEGVK